VLISLVHRAGPIPVPPVAERRGFFIPAAGRRAWWIPVIFAAAAACDGVGGTRTMAGATVVDDRGRAVDVDAPAQRVVSLVPSVTDLIVALGAADRLVARTAYDGAPSLAHLPSFGRTLSPSVEALVRYDPDLIIMGGTGLGAVARIDALDTRVYVADVQRIADILTTAERVGALLGVRARADSLVAALAAGLNDVRARVHGEDRPTVLYLLWPDPPQAAGSNTFIDDVITVAGGRNAFDDLPGSWPVVSLEEVVRRDPRFVVLPRAEGATIRPAVERRPGWRSLSALREGRVIPVDADLFDRPGPRVVEAARILAAALHPDARLP
jgi:iron complex transport system substrate-binding protein